MPEKKRKQRHTERRVLFGQLCIKNGFITKEQLKEALEIQRKMDERGEKHKLLGMIMLEKTMISTEQLIKILMFLDEHRSELS